MCGWWTACVAYAVGLRLYDAMLLLIDADDLSSTGCCGYGTLGQTCNVSLSVPRRLDCTMYARGCVWPGYARADMRRAPDTLSDQRSLVAGTRKAMTVPDMRGVYVWICARAMDTVGLAGYARAGGAVCSAASRYAHARVDDGMRDAHDRCARYVG